MFFMQKERDERSSYVVALGQTEGDWKYKPSLLPEFVKRKVWAVMSANLGMTWRQAIDLIYERRRKAIARSARKARIAASRKIDPR